MLLGRGIGAETCLLTSSMWHVWKHFLATQRGASTGCPQQSRLHSLPVPPSNGQRPWRCHSHRAERRKRTRPWARRGRGELLHGSRTRRQWPAGQQAACSPQPAAQPSLSLTASMVDNDDDDGVDDCCNHGRITRPATPIHDSVLAACVRRRQRRRHVASRRAAEATTTQTTRATRRADRLDRCRNRWPWCSRRSHVRSDLPAHQETFAVGLKMWGSTCHD